MSDSEAGPATPLKDSARRSLPYAALSGTLRILLSLLGMLLLVRYLPYFTPEESRRFEVPPGITGLQQVSGRNLHGWDTRLAQDVEYVRTCSLRLDLWILVRTLLVVVTRRGLQVDPGAVALDLDVERRARRGVEEDSLE